MCPTDIGYGMKAKTPEQKRIKVLERALEDLLETMQGHRCPYCGGTECPVTVARNVLTPTDALPLYQCETIYHVGTLRKSDKGIDSHAAHVGPGLAVSECPDEWRRIARLGDAPCWKMELPGGCFLDFHNLEQTQRAALLAWAVQRELLCLATRFEVRVHDDELDDTLIYLYKTCEDAEAEHELDKEAVQIQTHVATERLHRRIGFEVPDANAVDLAIVCYVEDMTRLDGIWWHDRHGPLSAPRGVILPERLLQWQVSPCEPQPQALEADEPSMP
jgi:hypothetical protein